MTITAGSVFAPLGHDAAVGQFAAQIKSGRLHHAWLFTGAPGIGKATLAMWMARLLLDATDPDSPAGRRVSARTHADLLVIERGFDEKRGRTRSEILVDDVKKTGDFLRRTAAEGGWRVVIIDGVDYMNRNAANALLKSLEEPPENAILIMTCDAPGRLLPTIRSRCRIIPLQPLSRDYFSTVLARQKIEPAIIESLAPRAGGSPGRALWLLGDADGAIARLVSDLFEGTVAGPGEYERAETLLKKDGGFEIFFSLLVDAVSSLARREARLSREGIQTEATLAALSRKWEELKHIRREAERFNLDKLQAVLAAFKTMSDQ